MNQKGGMMYRTKLERMDVSSMDELLDEIDDYEEESDESLHNTWYIGCAAIVDNDHLFINKIKPQTFFKFSYDDISLYFYMTSCVMLQENPAIDIVKLAVEDDIYYAIKKTYYIKIIQRTWKTLFQKRKAQELRIRKNIGGFLDDFQRKGRPIEYFGICGMLSHYSQEKLV